MTDDGGPDATALPRSTPRRRTGADRATDRDRAVVPSVGKALEASLVLLYVALLSTALYGGFVPEYRASAGQELADRTVTTAAHEVRATVPPPATEARAERSVELPDTIAGDSYRVRAANGSLVLDHPDLEARARLALPDRVVGVEGEWYSEGRTRVVVVPADDGDGVLVRLADGPDPDGGGES